MATTYRDIINRVLVALGEDEISSSQNELTSKYHKLIGMYVNQIKEIVEDAHQWSPLVNLVEFQVTAGSNQATLTGGQTVNNRLRLMRQHDPISGTVAAVVADVTASNNPYLLREIPQAELQRKILLDSTDGGDPDQFSFVHTTQDNPVLEIYPKATETRTIRGYFYNPRGPWGNGDLDETLEIPTRPVELGTIWYALQERGEELGTSGPFSQELFEQALGEAVGRDADNQGLYQLVPV